MTPSVLSYGVVTPLRNEPENMRRLAGCMVEQTVRPSVWILVDNGSTDETLAQIDELAATHDWILVTHEPGMDRPAPGAPIVRAFARGLELLGGVAPGCDVIVKLDADVSFAEDYFERLLFTFGDDPTLGIAGGVCLELDEYGQWQPTHVTGDHVRGAARAYRRECLEGVLPLPERVGWDGVDELKAAVLGWRTGIVPGLSFRHHRKVGARDGGRFKRWIAQGDGAYFMGYRFDYLVIRAVHHSRRDVAALAMVWGYAAAAGKRSPRYDDPDVRRHLREQQRLRNLLDRRREALGRG